MLVKDTEVAQCKTTNELLQKSQIEIILLKSEMAQLEKNKIDDYYFFLTRGIDTLDCMV